MEGFRRAGHNYYIKPYLSLIWLILATDIATKAMLMYMKVMSNAIITKLKRSS